jgi:SOS-response transcriptional repressor LexA
MTVDALIKEVEGKTSEVKEITRLSRSIDIIDLVGAGLGLDGGQVIGDTTVPLEWAGDYVAYYIEGASMMPTIPAKAVVKVLIQDHAEPGELVVCYCGDCGMVLKEYAGVTPDGYHIL